MDDNMVRQLCVRALSRSVGSMEYVDSLLIMEDDDDDDDSGGNNFEEESEETTPTGSGGSQPPLGEPAPDWCKCRHCQAMAQEIENKCCGLRKCITTSRRFEKLCLDPEVLELCIRNRADIRNDREDTSTSSFRKAAYRQSWSLSERGTRASVTTSILFTIRIIFPSIWTILQHQSIDI